jgi:hypothetical protein
MPFGEDQELGNNIQSASTIDFKVLQYTSNLSNLSYQATPYQL